MAYTNVWDDTQPTGSEAANTIDDIFRSLKVDIEQRFIDIFGMPNFTADPLRPYMLKFADAADAKITFGDNAGTPRSIVLKNKADSVTYATWAYTGLTLSPPALTGSSTPFFSVTQTWNNGATTFVGMLVNITNTASAAASLFFDYQIGGASQWKVSRAGVGTLTGALTVGSQITTTQTSGIVTLAASATTSSLAHKVQNTSGVTIWGVESNAGGDYLTGGSANASFFGSFAALPVEIATNATVRFSISASGIFDYKTNPINGVSVAYFNTAESASALATLGVVSKSNITSIEAGGIPFVRTLRVNGSLSVPTIITNGDIIGDFRFQGFLTGTTVTTGASVRSQATENWVASTNAGTKLVFLVTPNTTVGAVTGMTLDQDKSLTVVGAFGCNAATAQAAYASGGALAAYGAGANGLDSGANMQALHGLVVNIRAALVANGIMS